MRIIHLIVKTIKYLLIAVMLLIFVSNFYVMLMSAKNPGTHPAVFGYQTAVVISGSMEPAISVDDVVVIKKEDRYHVGDVIAFTTDKSFVTHRIVEAVPEGFITRGDANNTNDAAPVPHSAISGKVIYTVPHLGGVTAFLKTPLGMMLIVLLAFFAIIFPDNKEDAQTQD